MKFFKKNKGFTLVELLAVFVILGVVAMIAIVSLRGIKVDYEKSSYEQSVKGVLTAAQQKYASEGYTGMPAGGYGIGEIEVENSRQYVSGTVKLINDKLHAVNISNGAFCANGPIDDLVVVEGECPSTDTSCFTYKIKTAGVTITGIDTTRSECVGDVVVPAFIEEKPVVEIGYAAFADIGEREIISSPAPEAAKGEVPPVGFLPNTNKESNVSKTGSGYYYYGYGLSDESLPFYKGFSYSDPTNNKLEYWTWYRFGEGTKSITSVSLPISITKIDDYAFANSGITSINLSSLVNLKTIGDSAFGLTNLTNVKLSGCSSLQSIGIYAFYGSLIENLDLTDLVSLKYIKNGAFENNFIRSVNFEGTNKLLFIGESAFLHNEITDIHMNNLVNLDYVGIHSFCDNLFEPYDIDISNLYNRVDSWLLRNACLANYDS